MKYLFSFVALAAVSASMLSFLPFQDAKKGSSFDFGRSKTGSNWKVMNDGVMGGLSSGESVLKRNSLILEGEISLANNGGFSSVRSPWGKTDISDYSTIEVRYRSEGQVVAFCIETNRMWWKPYYMLDLPTTDNKWETITLKLTDASEISLVTPTGNTLTKKQLEKILRFGFMTHEKKESPFRIEVDYVKFK